jgi:hypothetical protein
VRLAASLTGVVAALALLTLIASSAVAARPLDHYHYSFTCATPSPPNAPCPVELPTDQCGIPGTTVDSQWGNVQLFADGTSKTEMKEKYVFTSSVTGKSFEGHLAEQLTTSTTPVDNGDGTISFYFAFKGLELQLKLPNGHVLARDAGPVTFVQTFDAVTGDFVSFMVADEKGPHPIVDSGFELFCDVIVPALS